MTYDSMKHYGEAIRKKNAVAEETNKLKAYGWGIVDKNEKPYFSSDCVAQHPEDLRQTIEYLNEPEGDEDHRAPWRVVPLFYKDGE